MNKIEEYSICKIASDFNHFLNIPIYQRPYSWEKLEIETLLGDFYDAFEDKKDENYYIGNIVVYQNSENSYDIIDGQQRFTTLFLIAIINEWKEFIKINDKTRLKYEIRESDDLFLKNLIDGNPNSGEVSINIKQNLEIIKEFFNKKNDPYFKDFIFNKVKFVITTLDNGIDINRYFEVMNNRGVQLEKHHILKANLLSKIDNDLDRKKYAKIWDFCSDMSVYIENSIKRLLGKNDDEKSIENIRNNLLFKDGYFDEILAKIEERQHNKISILKILNKDNFGDKSKDIISDSKYRSIVNFETFLLHVYKISIDHDIKLNDSMLLEIINIDKVDSKKFIEDLFKYRVLFDQFIFKRDISTKEPYIQNMSSSKDLLMIELLFDITSDKSKPWLNDTLKFLDENRDESTFVFISYLENLDKEKAKERQGDNSLEDILNKGTSTSHYWFYKLDYLLWKKYDWKSIKLLNGYDIKKFRLKNLSSIEHVYPQNPKDGAEWSKEHLNSFGNLALISDSMNSSFSNNPYKEKRKLLELQLEKGTSESLKMILLYSKYSEEWSFENCQNHHQEMLEIMEKQCF